MGQLRTQPYEGEQWEVVNVELTKEQLIVKQRDLVHEDTMASNVCVYEVFLPWSGAVRSFTQLRSGDYRQVSADFWNFTSCGAMLEGELRGNDSWNCGSHH